MVPVRCGAHSTPVRPGVDVARAGVWLTVRPCVRAQDVFAAALGTIVAPLPITHPVATLGDIVNHRNANGLAPLHVAYGGRFGAHALFVCCCLCAYTPTWVRTRCLFAVVLCAYTPAWVRRAPCAVVCAPTRLLGYAVRRAPDFHTETLRYVCGLCIDVPPLATLMPRRPACRVGSRRRRSVSPFALDFPSHLSCAFFPIHLP